MANLKKKYYMLNILNFNDFLIQENISCDVEIISEIYPDILEEYILEKYGIILDDELYLIINESDDTKASGGIKGHFKKHWKKYAAGAAGAAAIGGAAYLGHKKGLFNGKAASSATKAATSSPVKHIPKPGSIDHEKQSNRYSDLQDKILNKMDTEKDPHKKLKMATTLRNVADRAQHHTLKAIS